MTTIICIASRFLSTLSLRRATTSSTVIVILRKNFYPRSPCGERPTTLIWDVIAVMTISIHALLAESDRWLAPDETGSSGFLSTLSLRRATEAIPQTSLVVIDFYPRSPCGERPKAQDEYKDTVTISIHALLAESDLLLIWVDRILAYFYPRSPCGERLFLGWIFRVHLCISIHALLAESDRF